jgi:hypothetical protein
MQPDPERVAHEALTAFARRSLLLIVFARQGERTLDHGSGTLIVGPSGRVGVLTAAHVVRPGDLVSLVTIDEFHQDVVDEVVPAPNNVDVAIAFVRQSVGPALRERALALESIEFSTERQIPKGALLVAAGFPEQFTYDERHPTHGWLQHRFVDILNPTSDFKHDHRFISIGWKQGTVTGKTFPFEDLGDGGTASKTEGHPTSEGSNSRPHQAMNSNTSLERDTGFEPATFSLGTAKPGQ